MADSIASVPDDWPLPTFPGMRQNTPCDCGRYVCQRLGGSGVFSAPVGCPCGKTYETIEFRACGPDPYLPTVDGQPPRPDLFPGLDVPGSPPPKRAGFLRRLFHL